MTTNQLMMTYALLIRVKKQDCLMKGLDCALIKDRCD